MSEKNNKYSKYSFKIFNKLSDIEQDQLKKIIIEIQNDNTSRSYELLKVIEESNLNIIPFYFTLYLNNTIVGISFACIIKKMTTKQAGPSINLQAYSLNFPFTFDSGLYFSSQEHIAPYCHFLFKYLSKHIKPTCILLGPFEDDELNNINKYIPKYFVKMKFFGVAHLNLNHNSFEEYLFSLKKSSRIRIRRKINRFKRNNLSFEICRDSITHAEKLLQLYKNVQEKSQLVDNIIFNLKFFKNINNYLGSAFEIILLKQGMEIVGFCLLQINKPILDWTIVGIDYNNIKESEPWFHLSYEIIRYAIHNKYQRVVFGATSLKAKKQLGCFIKAKDVYLGASPNIFSHFLKIIGILKTDFFTRQDGSEELIKDSIG